MADETGAGEALAGAQAARARLAGAADCPRWRHAAFGALMGGVTAAQALPGAWVVAGELTLMCGAFGLYAYDRATKGVWLNGYRRGTTRRVTFAMLAVFLVVYSLSVLAKVGLGWGWAPLAGGALVAVAADAFSRRWSRVYRREVEGRL